MKFATGVQVGNGAAINIELGWIPDFALVYNGTDGDVITGGFLNDQVIPFSSGGTNEVAVGDTIIGATSLARAIVKQVLVSSGTWAAGDAAGFFVVGRDSIEGTFGSENVYVEGDGTTNDATVTANVTHSFASSTAVAAVTTTSALLPYAGVAGSAAKGFTIGSVVAEEAKLLRWAAWRNG